MENKQRKIEDFVLEHSRLLLVLIYNTVTTLVVLGFYPIFPTILMYAPGTLEISKKLGASIDMQYIVVIVSSIIIGTLFMLFTTRGIGKISKYKSKKEVSNEQMDKIRTRILNLPYLTYILQISIVNIPLLILMVIIKSITDIPFILLFRIFVFVFSMFSLAAILSLVFTKRIFTTVLLKSYNNDKLTGIRLNLRNKIFLQVIPIAIIAILVTAMLGYARIIEEKSDLAYKIVKGKMDDAFKDNQRLDNEDGLKEILKKINLKDFELGYFLVSPDNKFITDDGFVPTAYFRYYALNPVNGDRVYGDSTEYQGVIKKVVVNGQEYSAGIRFRLDADKTLNYFLISFFALMILITLVLYYFSKSISDEISLIAKSLTEIAEGDHVDLDRKLAVISNDELGDLVVAFNKIQEREKLHIQQIKETQQVLMEQERLASLGQLIGGIAHNLKTPIMSLAGGIEGLKDLIKEYDDSIEDENVTKEDHHEIAKEMREWVGKLSPHCSYMSDIITAVRAQTAISSHSKDSYFTIVQLIDRVKILMNHELRHHKCNLNTEYDIDLNTKINGDISNLVQVISNLLVNSAHAYEDDGGDIDFKVEKCDNYIKFTVRDYAKGIPEKIKDKLLKEMVTTKGKRGTGLGLYMSYSNIKARFSGDMWFESEEGKGTTFYITIPLK